MDKGELIRKVEGLIPQSLLIAYRKTKRYLIWKRQLRLYAKEVKRLSGTKEPLNVVFLVLSASVWKYDSVYQLMEKDKRFNPLIMVCPAIDLAENQIIPKMNQTYAYLSNKGYKVIKACDENRDNYVGIESLSPDILFYASQWDEHFDEQYRSTTLRKYLKCYVNYSYKNNPFEWSIASPFQGRMWMYFSECEDNRKLALSFNANEFQNIHVVGYPIYDEIQALDAKGTDWKIQDKKHKRIIWAPHHSIEGHDGLIKLSTFLLYSDSMKELAEKFADKVQFAFKPHPQLKTVLYHHPDWGQEKTDAYYNFWRDGKNTAIVDGAYADLFKSSDAMIHDCHSFVVEYLYVNKPVMFLANYDREGQSNTVGKKAFAAHYHGLNAEDIERFITDVVIGEKDTMQTMRNEFYQNILVPPNGKTVAENIVEELSKALKI